MVSRKARIHHSRDDSNESSSVFDCESLHSQRKYTLNSLWSVWYCALAMAFQIYIIANSIHRFTTYLSLPWPNGQPPFSTLNAYVVFIGAGVVVLPFFVVVSMMKVGNYSNDGHKLGDQRRTCDPFNNSNNIYQNIRTPEIKRKAKRFRVFRLMWKHSVPTAPLLHLIAALCFLIPRILMETQLISHGFFGKGDIWKTELDFVLNKLEDKRMPILAFLNPINDSDRRLLNLESYSVNQYLRKEASPLHLTNKHSDVSIHLEESGNLSMETINLILAFFVMAVRYPSVFWLVNKSFALLFSLQLILNTIQCLFMFSAFQVLLKVIICDPTKVLIRQKVAIILNSYYAVILFILYILLMWISSTTTYIYGLQKYKEWRYERSRKMRITWRPSKIQLFGYFPHLCSFIILIMICLCSAPLVHDLIVIYCGSLDGATFVGIISFAIHVFFWIFLWLALTIKNKWKFSSPIKDNDDDNDYGIIYRPSSDKYKKNAHDYGDPPLLVIDNGKTYQIRETNSRKTILNMAHKSRIAQKLVSPNDDGEDIYWLRPEKESMNDKTGHTTWPKYDRKNDRNGTEKDSKGKRKIIRRPSKRSNKNAEIDFDAISNGSDGEYATLKQIVNSNVSKDTPTHKSLCPLRDERISPQRTIINPTRDGDYELLVDHSLSYLPQTNFPIFYDTDVSNTPNKQSQIMVNTESNCHSPAMTSTSTPINGSATNHFIKDVQHNHEQLTPRSGSISETSNSPEKASDTSSGVHSNSSNGANSSIMENDNEKRSASVEDMVQHLQNIPAPKQSFKSLSLQRYMSSMTQRSTCPGIPDIPDNEQLNESTMVIRRAKRQPNGLDNNSHNTYESMNAAYGACFDRDRATNVRMTSFTDGDYYKSNSLPFSQKILPMNHQITSLNGHEFPSPPPVESFCGQKAYVNMSLNPSSSSSSSSPQHQQQQSYCNNAIYNDVNYIANQNHQRRNSDNNSCNSSFSNAIYHC